MKKIRWAIAALGLALLVPLACAASESIPPTPTQFVTDTQGALSAQTRHSVDAELQAYERATGHQIIVYIGSTTGSTPFGQWTVDTAERWGIGRKGHGDGAVLFIMMKEHKIRIEVGYGLEPKLTDAQSFWIIENVITSQMRAGNTDAAVQDGVDHILTTITPSYAATIGHAISVPASSGRENRSGGLGGGILYLLVFFGFFIIVIVMLIVGSVRYLFTLLTKGPAAAAKAWHNTWVSSGTSHGSLFGAGMLMGGLGGFGGGGFGGGGFGGGFSAGGGGFGGGGASGGW